MRRYLLYEPSALPGSSVYYIFLMANVPFTSATSLPRLEHFWSLGVEEQFYLFWPWIVKVARKPIWAMLAVFFGHLALRVLFRQTLGLTAWPYWFLQVTRFDCMAVGSIGAILYHGEAAWFTRLAQHPVTQLGCWTVIGVLAINRYHVPLVGHDVVAGVTACIIISQITKRNRIIKLDNRAFEFLGKISYGLYVIHPLVVFYFARVLRPVELAPLLKELLAYTGVLVLTVGLATLSYAYFELPFLRQKTKYAVIKTAP